MGRFPRFYAEQFALSGGAPNLGAPDPAWYLNPDDSVNDGGGKVLECVDRVTGNVFDSTSSTLRFTRNTSFVANHITWQSTAQNQLMRGTVSGTWNGTQALTLVQRANVTTANVNMHFCQLDRTAAPTTDRTWFYGNDSTQKYMIYGRTGTGGGSTTGNSSAVLIIPGWYTYAWVYDGANVTFYRNTSALLTVARGGTISGTIDRLCFGTYPSGGANGFVGHRGGSRGFRRALTANEIALEHALLSSIWS